jgi:hypothetical protein
VSVSGKEKDKTLKNAQYGWGQPGKTWSAAFVASLTRRLLAISDD